MMFAAGQRWTYRTPAGFEASRLVIGAIVEFAGHEPVLCCLIEGAPRRRPDGSVDTVTIPFLPMTERAVRDSVVTHEGTSETGAAFAASLAEWQQDPRGMSAFTVPFEGFLDRMIALQMAEIVGQPAA